MASLPIDTSRVRPFTFPKFEPEQKFDEEGNLMIGDLVLKKFDVKPTDIDYHLQQCEEYPTFKLKVIVLIHVHALMYMYMYIVHVYVHVHVLYNIFKCL